MLQHLSIKNYALIEHLEIDFNRQLNILTGETGSGKSIILGALGLILGERAETRVVQEGKNKCIVEAGFQITELHLKPFFEKYDLDFEPVTLIRREILASGKSRAFVNDTPVTLQILKKLGSYLIDIHSQHQTIQINDSDFQLAVLDRYSQSQNELAAYQNCFAKYIDKQKELAQAEKSKQESIREVDFITFQLQELKAARLDEIDAESFEEEYNTLSHTEEITQTLNAAIDKFNGDNFSVLQALHSIRESIDHISHISKTYADISERLKSTEIELDDISSELENILSGLEADPRRLQILEEIRSTIFRLEQKHGVEGVEALIKQRDNLEEKLNFTHSLDEEVARIERELKVVERELIKLGKALSAKRAGAATAFATEVEKVLELLNMKSAKLELKISAFDQPGSKGFDQLTILFSANAGRKPEPLKHVASGGELSRLMLAIKKVSAIKNGGKSIVFDEIDTGVSGEVAHAMGNIMKEMSTDMQVISITHLPQIASKGDAHFKVYKTEEKGVVKTKIQQLNTENRIVEIAQMLSGASTTAAAMENARELLKLKN